MKQAQIEALVSALRGRADTVSSLYVLRQAALSEDDEAFLRRHKGSLEVSSLLLWLAKSSDSASRGAIVRLLAQTALVAPERFRFEVLGAGKKHINEDEWGEIAEHVRGQLTGEIFAEICAHVGGSNVFKAFRDGRRRAPERPIDPTFFIWDKVEGEALRARIERAFEPKGAASRTVFSALFDVRYDEAACRRMLSNPPQGIEPERWWFEVERAGWICAFGPGALPETTRFSCEGAGDEDARLRAAYLRYLAFEYGGEAGLVWLVREVEAALGRGALPAALLAETPPAVRERIPPELSARFGGAAETLPLSSALALRALLPGSIDIAALAERAGREAEEGEEDWGPLAELLPPGLGDAAVGRARRSQKGPELVALLDWMLAHERPRKAAFELSVSALRRGLLHRALISWLASQLTTRAAWEQAGAEVVSALIGQHALPELNDLLALAWSLSRRDNDDDAEPPEGFRQAVHAAFAIALHDAIGEAVRRNDEASALRLASALACLDPPPRFRRRLTASNGGSGNESVEQILDVVRSITRHGGGRDASLRDAIAAVHALASVEPFPG